MDHKKKRRSVVIAALVLCLAAVTGLGTLAWMTQQDSKQNVFTLGAFNTPEDNPGDHNEDKDEEGEPDSGTPEGFLTETKWVKDSKLYDDAVVAKNPNVGIGQGSDDAYVFVYVQNKMLKDEASEKVASESPYFTLNDNWQPVSDDLVQKSTAAPNAYTGGLFMYKTSDETEAASILEAIDASVEVQENQSGDVYTGEAFSTVTVPADLENFDNYADVPTMNVYALLYSVQYSDGTPVESGDGSATAAVEYAKTWSPTQTGA